MPLVSIITPSLNQVEFIEETILSVKNQDYELTTAPFPLPQGERIEMRGIEHIVIDGGSTDGTIEILKKYPHLTWISEPDRGQSDAINKGFKMAKGEIIGWVNSDDTYLQDTIKTICDYLTAHPEVEMIFGDCNYIDQKSRIIKKMKGQPLKSKQLILKGNCINQPTVFFRREIFKKVGYLDTQWRDAMDFEYWVRIELAGCRIDYIPKTLANFRLHKNSKTSKRIYVQKKETLEIRKKYANWINDIALKDLEQLKEKKIKRILIFGTGRGGEILYFKLKEDYFEVLGFMDSRKERWGEFFLKKRIFSLDEARVSGYDAILIGSQDIEEIKNFLQKNGITEKIIVPLILREK